ncbi:MAG: CehA/McbA family metallohydrolase [Bacteroidota bacterium]
MRIGYTYLVILVFSIAANQNLYAQRISILNQIDLPHNYYFHELYIPQLTSSPSSVAWMPDSKSLVYSMAGSLWKQDVESNTAQQLTDSKGYDYQPDVAPDGQKIIFVRYNGTSMELMLLDVTSGETKSLTDNKAVNLEPRWSPDGNQVAYVSTFNTGHFLLHVARIENDQFTEINCVTPDRKSNTKRYYYSAFDHAINPVWSKDGKEIYFISNKEIAHGTGDILSINEEVGSTKAIHHEETSWRTKPDISPDGSRLVYSSYLGRNWHQLWLLPVAGGYPIPLTYGEYDNTAPRWSPDGEKIAFISNRDGNTSLWIVNVFNGGQKQIIANKFQYLKPQTNLLFSVRDENGNSLPARISITDSRGKFYAPANAWIQADDSKYLNEQKFESHYFHTKGIDSVMIPRDKLIIQVSHGPEYEIFRTEIDVRTSIPNPFIITLKKQNIPSNFGNWWSGDLHVHMNYGGNYRNTPAILASQAEAEDLNFVFNMIVNKEQRVPDIQYYTPLPDNATTNNAMILHAQEFHTSFWGHLGLLNINDHIILPGYSGYPQTAVESLFPHNSFVADRAHEQHGLVGYVHPFEKSEIFPDQSATLFNELPIDVALGKVNYFELIGFSDHKASEAVWYQLLNCGFRIPAGAGTDAMANYSSLRGPVGLNRVYVNGEGELDHKLFLKNLVEGKSFVTNGPLLGFTVEGKNAGDSITLVGKEQKLSYTAFLRSQVPIDHFEIIWNGEVVAKHTLTDNRKTADAKGSVKVTSSGWLLLRAWSEKANIDLPDVYPYSSTNPIYVKSQTKNSKQKVAAEYFLKWVNRIETKVNELHYRNVTEKELVLKDNRNAKLYYQQLIK